MWALKWKLLSSTFLWYRFNKMYKTVLSSESAWPLKRKPMSTNFLWCCSLWFMKLYKRSFCIQTYRSRYSQQRQNSWSCVTNVFQLLPSSCHLHNARNDGHKNLKQTNMMMLIKVQDHNVSRIISSQEARSHFLLIFKYSAIKVVSLILRTDSMPPAAP